MTHTDCKRQEEEIRRLRQEADDLRYQDERRRETEQQQRAEARRERMQEAQARMHCAESWPDAFEKGLTLYSREVAEETRDNARIAAHLALHPEDAADPCWQLMDYFTTRPEAIRRSHAIYSEVMAEVDRQIEELRAGALQSVAGRVEAEIEDREFAEGLAEALRNDYPDWLVDW